MRGDAFANGDGVCAVRGLRLEQRAGSLIVGKGPIRYAMILWHDGQWGTASFEPQADAALSQLRRLRVHLQLARRNRLAR
jgi:hypothetical protein